MASVLNNTKHLISLAWDDKLLKLLPGLNTYASLQQSNRNRWILSELDFEAAVEAASKLDYTRSLEMLGQLTLNYKPTVIVKEDKSKKRF